MAPTLRVLGWALDRSSSDPDQAETHRALAVSRRVFSASSRQPHVSTCVAALYGLVLAASIAARRFSFQLRDVVQTWLRSPLGG